MMSPAKWSSHPHWDALVSQYGRREAIEILESGIPLNRPGVVPSLQVPSVNRGCRGLGNPLETGTIFRTTVYALGPDGEIQRAIVNERSTPIAVYGIQQALQNASLQIAQAQEPAPAGIPGQVTTTTSAGQGTTQQLMSWMEANWMLAALGVGAVVLFQAMRK